MFQQLALNVLAIVGIMTFWQLGQGLGAWVLAKLAIRLTRPLDRILVGTAVGWIVIGYLLYVLGLAGLLYTAILITLVGGLAIVAVRVRPWDELRRLQLRGWLSQLSPSGKFLALIFTAFTILNLINALAPDVWFDSTWYHLTTAQTYLNEHTARLAWPSIFDVSSIAPHLPDMLFTLLLLPAKTSSTLPQLFSWVVGIGLAAGTYSLGRRILKPDYALVAGVIIYGTAIVSWLSQSAYIDLLPAFLGTTAIIAIFAWSEQEKGICPRFLIAILLAGFLSSKMQSLAFLPVFFLVMLWSQYRPDEQAYHFARRLLPDVLWIGGLSLLFTLPWYLEIWAVTGSPLFTFRQAAAGSEFLAGAPTLIDWIIRAHLQTFFQVLANFFIPEATIYLVALAGFLFWKYLPKTGRILLTAGWLSVLAWSYIPIHEIRYGLLAFALLAVSVAWMITIGSVARLLGGLGLIVFLVVSTGSTLELARSRWPVALGFESRDEFLQKTITDSIYTFYDSGGAVQRNVGNGKALALVHNAFYLDVPWVDAVRLKATTYGEYTTIEQVIDAWRKTGITHLVIHGPWELNSFVDQHDFPGGSTRLPLSEQKKLNDYVIERHRGVWTKVWELR